MSKLSHWFISGACSIVVTLAASTIFVLPVQATTNPVLVDSDLVVTLDDTTPASALVTPGQSAVTLAKYKFSAYGNDVGVSKITFTLDPAIYLPSLTNLTFLDGSTVLGNSATVVNNTLIFSSSSNWLIPANSYKTLTIRSDITSVAQGTIKLRVSQVSAIDMVTANNLVVSLPDNLWSNTMTVSGSSAPTLKIVKVGSGSGTVISNSAINCGNTCSATFPTGTTITLKASPWQDSSFIGWSGCQPEAAQLSCTVTLNSDTTVSANFGIGTTGSVSTTLNSNSVSADLTQGQTGATLSKVNLAVSSATSVYLNGVQVGSDSNGSVDAFRNIKVYLDGSQLGNTIYSLTPGRYNQGWALFDPVILPAGSTKIITIIADIPTTAPTGVIQLGMWGLNFAGAGSYVLGLPVKGPIMTIVGSVPTLKIVKVGSGSGTVFEGDILQPGSVINCGNVCSASFLKGTTITLTAAPDSGSVFTSWQGCANSTDPKGCRVQINGDVTITANFSTNQLNKPDLIVDSITLDPSVPQVGQSFKIKAVVKNIGTADAYITNSYPLSGPTANLHIVGPNYDYVEGVGGANGTYDNPPIKPGYTATYVFGKFSPIQLPVSGSYKISVTADGGGSDSGGIGVITELKEDNNTLTKTVSVGSIIPKVDLKVNGSDGPINVARGSTLKVAWTSNTAGCTTFGSYVKVLNGTDWIKEDTLPPSGDKLLLAEVASSPDGNYFLLGIQCTTSDGNNQATDQIVVNMGNTQSVNISSPLGGEQWQIGNKYSISWDASNVKTTDRFNIGIIKPGFSDGAVTIATGLDSTVRSFDWVIPTTVKPYGYYSVIVSLCGTLVNGICGNGHTDYSHTISIVSTSTQVRVVSPDGGEEYTVGQNIVIKWVGGKKRLQIGLFDPARASADRSGLLGFINSNILLPDNVTTANQGSFEWNSSKICDMQGNCQPLSTFNTDKFKIVLISEDDNGNLCMGGEGLIVPCNYDLSDTAFTININDGPSLCSVAPTVIQAGPLGNPGGTGEFEKLGLDTSKHPEIMRYRIQWFSGAWSPWYVPGVGDEDWNTNLDGTKRRVWSYFDDHNHEFEVCSVSPTVNYDLNKVDSNTIQDEASSISKGNIIDVAPQSNIDKAEELLSRAQVIMSKMKALQAELDQLTPQLEAIKNFIALGTTSTERLSANDRAAVVTNYQTAFGKVPETTQEWQDVVRIANDQAPTEVNTKLETQATKTFQKIYKRKPNRVKNVSDDKAVETIAYGIMPEERNLKAEQAAIGKFMSVYRRKPSTSADWNTVRAIAYSGVKK